MTALKWVALALCSAIALRDGYAIVRNAWRGTWNQGAFIEFVIAASITVGLVLHLVLV